MFLRIAFALTLFAMFFAVVTLFFWNSNSAFRGEEFRKEIWLADEGCPGLEQNCTKQLQRCPRGAMVQDLRREYLNNFGTSKPEVISLIGLSDGFVQIRDRKCETYFLGMCSSMSFDGDSLYVCYDQEDKLVRSGHIKH